MHLIYIPKVDHSIIKMETLSSRWLMHTWTKEENKTFESALAFFDEETPNKWIKVAALIPGKSVNDVVKHYLELVADVNDIDAGLVPVPGYFSSSFDVCSSSSRKRGRGKRGVPWTEDEHRRFLLGLEKHGKGDWKNISRNFVVTKTSTQVASHAQKYYLRQMCGGKDKKRPSIHDLNQPIVDIISSSDDQKPNDLITSPDQEWDHINQVFESAFTDSFIANPTFHYIASCLL